MNRAELIKIITTRLNEREETKHLTQKDVFEVFNAFVYQCWSSLPNGQEVPLPGLGKLVVVERAARKSRTPWTGKPMDIPAKKAVKFKPAASLKEAVN